jgi:hypothetical protein
MGFHFQNNDISHKLYAHDDYAMESLFHYTFINIH